MKKSKAPIFFYILIFISTIVMTFCLTYLYFQKVNDGKQQEVNVKYVNLLTTFQNGNKIALNNMKKGLIQSYSFSVTNSNIDTFVDYKISLKIITPFSNIIDNNFVYSLESTTDSSDKENKLINKEETFIPITSTDIGISTISPSTTHNYVLTIKYKDTKDNIDFNNKIFVSEIVIDNVLKGN